MIGQTLSRAAVVTTAIAVLACAGRQHLGDYSFGGKTIALAYTNAPTPTLYSGDELNDMNPPYGAADRSPERVRRSMRAPVAQARFDTALATMNFARLLGSKTLARTTAVLGATAATDPSTADFVLDVDIERTAIQYDKPQNPVLILEGNAVLRDTKTGREIWRTALSRAQGLAQFRRETGARGDIGPVLPAHDTPVVAYQRLLENLAQFAAIQLTEPLGAPKATASNTRRSTRSVLTASTSFASSTVH